MSPLMTILMAETRHRDRIATASRFALRARQFFALCAGHAVELPDLPLTLPGMGVRRPHWWSAMDGGELAREASVGASDARCAHC